MIYRIARHDGGEDDITSNYYVAYDLLEEAYGDMCCSDADYANRPYYEIIEIKIDAPASKLFPAICTRPFSRVNRSCSTKSFRVIQRITKTNYGRQVSK